MKPENENHRNSGTEIPQQKPSAFPEMVECASKSAAGIPVKGKPNGFFRPMFVIGGAALCMGLTSCMVPYDSQGGGSVTVSSYSPGYTVTSLPGGYRSERISGSTYYYHDGSYYRQGSGGYVVVEAPRTSRYYTEYSRRQQTRQPDRGYRNSPNRNGQLTERGRVITRLPSGHRVVKHSGRTYYQAGDQYYSRQGEGYIVVSRPY